MYSGFNLKINAERDCGPDSINFLDPGYIKTGETHLGDVSGKVNQELGKYGVERHRYSGWRCHSE